MNEQFGLETEENNERSRNMHHTEETVTSVVNLDLENLIDKDGTAKPAIPQAI